MLITGKPTALTARASTHLDMIRGVAALAVMVGHIRGLFFLAYPDLTDPSPLVALLYVVTGLGHQAVMVFFVLSGFFVGGSVMAAVQRWSWKRYLVNRFTRLYLVLLPALLLTSMVDYFAYRQPGGHTYFDLPIKQFNAYPLSGRDSMGVFLGNALFLQGIVVPTFGSNSPLWSLANEFWYYLLFPTLVLVPFSPGKVKRRACGFLMALLLLAWLPAALLAGFLVWLLGVGVHSLPAVTARRGLRWGLHVLSAGTFCGTLMLSRVHRIPADWSDFGIGFAFSLWLYCLTKVEGARLGVMPVYDWFARLLSKCSYSVYAVHFPVVLLIRTSLGTSLWGPTIGNLVLGGAGCYTIFLFGLLFSRLTEAHTDTVRARLLRLISAGGAVAPAAKLE
jgi:peptidoglycan/LPS O-acetylase OafA/YrhL